MFTSITFYNHYHNGDLFVCKQFVRNLIEQCPELHFRYCHFNHKKTTADLKVEYSGNLDGLNDRMKFMIKSGELAINTWVGAYEAPHVQPPAFYQGGINLNLLHQIWSYLFENLTVFLNKPLTLNSDPLHFIPNIDYTCFDTQSVDQFASNHENIVLFSNGSPMSGQSFFGNMQDFVEVFAERYPKLTFVCTAKFNTSATNIYFTDDIITVEPGFPNSQCYWNQNLTKSDINEISYLSRFSKLIIGKNSGPFIYCLTKENMMNPDKTFVAFNNKPVDNLFYNLKTPANYMQVSNFDIAHMAQVLDSQLCRL